MVNKVTLIGRLGADPEVKRLENGAAVARIRMATNESYKDSSGNWQDRTEWHTVIGWRLLAEKAENSFKKGALIYVEGKLQTREWTDQNGNKRYNTDVVANYMRNISGKENSNQGGSSNFPSVDDAPPASDNYNNQSSVAPANETVTDSADDDLPF